MSRFLAVLRHEYKKIVYNWAFLIGTLLFPIFGLCVSVVPSLIFSVKEDMIRLVIVDPSNKLNTRIREILSGGGQVDQATEVPGSHSIRSINIKAEQVGKYVFVEYDATNKSDELIRRELNEKAVSKEIDSYLLIPENFEMTGAEFEHVSRRAGELMEKESLGRALNDAMRSHLLIVANVDNSIAQQVNRGVILNSKAVDEHGREKDSRILFIVSFAVAMMFYIILLVYGQVILGAVVEEKETRLSEILFSSASPIDLILGKLLGVGLAGLTQMAIWIGSFAALFAFFSTQPGAINRLSSLPNITPLAVFYFFIYFLVGYFVYAAIFALIGATVTTAQEGSQFSFPPIIIMVMGFFLSFAVMRDPNSTLSFWASIAPFTAPLTMPIRILSEPPPFWQIAVSLGLNLLVIAVLVWLAASVYRIGMLMYGKRASLPEVWKWIRQN